MLEFQLVACQGSWRLMCVYFNDRFAKEYGGRIRKCLKANNLKCTHACRSDWCSMLCLAECPQMCLTVNALQALIIRDLWWGIVLGIGNKEREGCGIVKGSPKAISYTLDDDISRSYLCLSPKSLPRRQLILVSSDEHFTLTSPSLTQTMATYAGLWRRFSAQPLHVPESATTI